MRIKGNIRIDIPTVRIYPKDGVFIRDYFLAGSGDKKITNELLHAIAIDYLFYVCCEKIDKMPVSAITLRRKAMRRLLHEVSQMHKIIDSIYSCPLLFRGREYTWNHEIYDFKNHKFIEKI